MIEEASAVKILYLVCCGFLLIVFIWHAVIVPRRQRRMIQKRLRQLDQKEALQTAATADSIRASIDRSDLAVLQELRFKVWRLEQEAGEIMQRGMERFHRREEIYAAYAREHDRRPDGLTEEEKKEAILASIFQDSED